MFSLSDLSTPSILWLVGLMLLVALAFGVQGFAELSRVRREAREDHAYRASRSMRGGEVALGAYETAYLRVHAPRRQLHIAAATALMALSTPLLLGLANAIMTGVWEVSGRDRTFEPLFLVYTFGVYFLLIFFWAFIALMVAHRFHRGTVERVDDMLYGEVDDNAIDWKTDLGRMLAIMGLTTLAFLVLGFVAAQVGLLGILAVLAFAFPLIAAASRYKAR